MTDTELLDAVENAGKENGAHCFLFSRGILYISNKEADEMNKDKPRLSDFNTWRPTVREAIIAGVNNG